MRRKRKITNDGPHGIDQFSSNGYGLEIDGIKVVPIDAETEERPTRKSFGVVEKFNPYHDEKGRFSSAGAGISFTYQTRDPKKQHWADRAVEREKERTKDWDKPKTPPKAKTNAPPAGTATQSDHPSGRYEGAAGVKKNTQNQIIGKEAQEMSDAITNFSISSYDKVREAGFKGSPPASAESKAEADLLDKYVDTAPKFDGTVYRGIGVDAETGQALVEAAKNGNIINQMGAASFSTDRKISEDFADMNAPDDGMAILYVSKGIQNGSSIKNISDIPGEDEVLMSSKARWKPTGVEPAIIQGKNGYIVYCEPFWGDETTHIPEPVPVKQKS